MGLYSVIHQVNQYKMNLQSLMVIIDFNYIYFLIYFFLSIYSFFTANSKPEVCFCWLALFLSYKCPALFDLEKFKFQNSDGSIKKRRFLLSKPNVFEKKVTLILMIEKFTNTTDMYGRGETGGMGECPWHNK